MSGFRHVVVFKWVEGTTVSQQEEVAERLRELPGTIPEIRAYSVGLDAGLSEDNADFAVVADFDGEAEFIVYRDHPAHRALIKEYIAPIIASRLAAQYAL
ncbi:Dabb family protein [Actinomadura parmotrematis]|uniref:Dabb family protein n=1 Tax=Actinomadura parmotrematis TaxID=2864039 RepID=A0ABS7FTF6_9ACTN|nr:Dabb family protein [Actinomadura parmotrematis]MBW8483692.1 Dabb family protein [Actinomadura parmotrematis]